MTPARLFASERKKERKEKLSPRLALAVASPNASIKICRSCGMGVLSSRYIIIMQIGPLKTHAIAIDGNIPRLMGWRYAEQNVMSSWDVKLKVSSAWMFGQLARFHQHSSGIELFWRVHLPTQRLSCCETCKGECQTNWATLSESLWPLRAA